MGSVSGEVPDSFFQCTLCTETLTEPKLLNCQHRFCRECLAEVGSSEIACPECNIVTKVPFGGVRDLETDVHTKQVIECREAHRNILGKGKKKRECVICNDVKRCSHYCFKCNGLLCDDCHHLHISDAKFKPHSTALINVKNVDATTLKAAFSELTRRMDAPRCRTHPKTFVDMLCITCGRVDICMACKFGEHKGHMLENMRESAQRLRDDLQDEMNSARKPKEFWQTLENRVRDADTKMKTAIAEMLEEAEEKVKKDLNVITAKRELLKEFKKRNSSRLSVCSNSSTIIDSYDVNRLSASITTINAIDDGSVNGTSYSEEDSGIYVSTATGKRDNRHKDGNVEKRRTSSTDASQNDGNERPIVSDSDGTMEDGSIPSSPTVDRLVEEDLSGTSSLQRSNSTPTRSKNGRSVSEKLITGGPLTSALSETSKDLRRTVSDGNSRAANTTSLHESSFYGSLSDLYVVGEDDDGGDFNRFTQERMAIERYNDALVRFLENLRDTKLSRVFEGVACLRKRYDNIDMTVKIIVSTQHDWAALKCVPGIMKALKTLVSDIHSHQKNLGIVEKINTKFIASATLNHFGLIEVSGSEISHVNLEDFMGKEWIVRNACWVGGSKGLAISSHNKNGISQVTLFSLKGKQNKNRQFNGDILSPWRYVATMNKKEVATACQPTEIGVSNLENGVQMYKNLREITPKWTKRRWVQCIAVDRTEKRILVGSGETDGHTITGTNKIEVYDYHLVHQTTLIIPQVTCCPQGLAVNKRSLLICDYYGQRALSCDVKDGTLNYEFPNLELDEGGWQPFSVCVDGHGYIYILWDAKMAESWKQIVIRYTPEGQPLTMREVDMNAMCIAITPAPDANERLTVVDREKGEMTHYGIL